jgi:hypothetical protein
VVLYIAQSINSTGYLREVVVLYIAQSINSTGYLREVVVFYIAQSINSTGYLREVVVFYMQIQIPCGDGGEERVGRHRWLARHSRSRFSRTVDGEEVAGERVEHPPE